MYTLAFVVRGRGSVRGRGLVRGRVRGRDLVTGRSWVSRLTGEKATQTTSLRAHTVCTNVSVYAALSY
jgi:hypothetical protein